MLACGGAGPICGDPAIIGEAVPDIDGPGACGVTGPVRLDAVAGVGLEPPPTVTCGTATALAAWLETGAKPAFASLGADLTGLEIAAHYVCRGRNNQLGAKLSEHAIGHALDVAAFRLADGTTVTVADGWNSGTWGPLLRRVHAAGCGPFGTTLGPGSDGFHQTHLHFDVAARRNGPYCRPIPGAPVAAPVPRESDPVVRPRPRSPAAR